jgi:signal transduction histidine kinase/PAS domain-containing protein
LFGILKYLFYLCSQATQKKTTTMNKFFKITFTLFALTDFSKADATTVAFANYHTPISLTYLLCILLIILGALSCVLILQLNKARQDAISMASHYSALFNNTNISTEFFDANGYLLDINEAACKLFEIKDREKYLKSRPNIFDDPVMSKLIDKSHPQPFNLILKEDFDEICKDKYFRHWNISGLHHIDTHFTPILNRQQRVIGFIVTDNDITEIIRLNEKLKSYTEKMSYVLKSTGTQVWTYYPDTRMCSSINDNENNPYRFSCQKLLAYVDRESKDEVIDIFEKMTKRETDKISLNVKFTNILGSRAPQYYMIEGSALRDKNGKITKYYGLSHNITKLIEIQATLEQEKEKALQADKLKSAFLTNMSHEIRTPLNAILGFSQILQSAENEVQRQNFINIINTNKDYLLKRINDIIELSEIKSGVTVPHPTKFDLVVTLAELCSSFELANTNQNVTINHSFTSDSYILYTDKRILMQIVYNFIDNAIKFTSKGHISIRFEKKDDTTEISVSDTGIGIPKDKTDDIFDSFWQLNPFSQGVGLGLTICKAHAKLLGGTICVKSEEQKGSTFSVRISNWDNNRNG